MLVRHRTVERLAITFDPTRELGAAQEYCEQLGYAYQYMYHLREGGLGSKYTGEAVWIVEREIERSYLR